MLSDDGLCKGTCIVKSKKRSMIKRISAAVLTAALACDMFYMPENIIQASAGELNLEESGDEYFSGTGSEKFSESDDENFLGTGSEDFSETGYEYFSGTVSDNSPEEYNGYELHLVKTSDMDEIPYDEAFYRENSEYARDDVINVKQSENIRISAIIKEPVADSINFKDALKWYILRKAAGSTPGTAHLVDEDDDWKDFETVADSPYFVMEECKDENSIFYKTVVITGADTDIDDGYDYYIRAEFEYMNGENECRSITTAPVIVNEDNDSQPIKDAEEGGISINEEAAEGDISENQDVTQGDILENGETSEAFLENTDESDSLSNAAYEGETVSDNSVSNDNDADAEKMNAEDMKTEENKTEENKAEDNKTEETDAEKNGDHPVDKDGNIIEITDEVWIAGFERESDERIYDGERHTQDIRVYHEGRLLKEKQDYSLTYKNNINAAEYDSAKAPSMTIMMKGQYSGSRTLYFTILPQKIDVSQGYEQAIQYGSKIKIPAPVIYSSAKKLVMNKDFTCDYAEGNLPEDHTDGASYKEGVSYEYTVNGKGNYTGSLTMRLTVIKDKNLNMEKATVKLDKKQYEYRGEALSASDVNIVSVKINNKILNSDLYAYRVFTSGAKDGYVEVYPSDEGMKQGYRGIKKVNIKLSGDRNIKDAEPGDNWQESIIFSQKNTSVGGEIRQENDGLLIYKKGGVSEPLKEGTDYTVKYGGNKAVGNAVVTFTGKGRYKGTLKKSFKILPNNELYVKWEKTDDGGMPVTPYMKGGAVPKFELMELPESESTHVLTYKKDYTVKVKNNKKPGAMLCEIVGKGNYKGYKNTVEVKVTLADISKSELTVSDKPYSSKDGAWKSAVTIKDVNGKKLKAGLDYDKNLVYSYEGISAGQSPAAGTVVEVTAAGINNYAGTSITGSYRIYNTNISKLKIVIDAKEYTGREVQLSSGDIHVYAGKSDAVAGKEIKDLCYEIVSYGNNIKAGTAKVTLRGIGNYGGTRAYSFKIKKKEYLTKRVTGISLDTSSFLLGSDGSRQLKVTIVPEDADNKTVIWSTSNSNVATVKNGLVTAVKSGKVTITAKSQDTGKKAVCNVTVSVVPVTSFELSETKIEQYEGGLYQLTVKDVRPENATRNTIEWESSNEEAASVDKNGLVSLNKPGMAIIKAYANERHFVRKCLVIVDSREEDMPEGSYVTPQMFRTYDDDDDTGAINDAILNLTSEYDGVYIPAGTYKIDAETSIRLKSNMKFIMSPDAVLKAVGNSNKFYDIIHVNDINNVTVSGGKIIGERNEHGSREGEWGMGIGIYDSRDINIVGTDVSECWGDGIYIGSHKEEDISAGCDGITVKDCNIHNNRRNNLSIVAADNVTVDNCKLDYAAGTAPEFGIDIETNNKYNPCEHITISNSTFDGNAQGSIEIVTAANDVQITGCTLNGNFVNYDGRNVIVSDTVINAEADARIGVTFTDGSRINDGSSEDDVLIASFSADKWPYAFVGYGIDDNNGMSCEMIEDSDSPSGKALRLKRTAEGANEAGYYIDLAELDTDGQPCTALEKDAVYRFEYVVKGNGQWGVKTDQTGWYPCVPMQDKFSTAIMTYRAGQAKSCRLYLYAVDTTEDMYLEIDSIKIYKVN